MKVYFAKDIHNLKYNKNYNLILGGVAIESNYSIVAHSDGDIIIHAIVSCLLASLNQKTLGEIFPDTKIENKNRRSIDFLKYVLEDIEQQKITINNIDLTIVCQKILLKDHLIKIKTNLSKLCKTKNVSIKVTRFEKKFNKQIECNCILTIK